MAILILLILAAAWAAFFLWPVIKGRSDRQRVDSVDRFTHHLRVIGRTGGHPAPGATPTRPLWAVPTPDPGTPSRAVRARRVAAAKRRRDVVLVLATALAGSLLLALVAGAILLWLLSAVLGALFATYLVLLAVVPRLDRPTVAPIPMLGPRPAPGGPVPLPVRRHASS